MDIEKESKGLVENYVEDILWYLSEYPTQRRDFAKKIKEEFCKITDQLVTELEESEEEEND